MRAPEVCIIAAMDKNRGIGKDNRLPWRIPADLKRFRELTVPYSVIMGRKTLESIVAATGRPLPDRHNFVITRDLNFSHPGVNVAHSIEEAFDRAFQFEDTRIAFIGGGQMYAQVIPDIRRIYLTVVEGQFEADTFFPDYSEFRRVISESRGESNGYRYQFLTLER